MTTSAMTTVLLVMRKPGNVRVMRQALDRLGYRSIGICSETELQSSIADLSSPRLGLVDVSDFGADVWSMCTYLKSHGIPFIVLSAPQALNLGNRSPDYGAAGILRKPIAKSALLQLIHGMAA